MKLLYILDTLINSNTGVVKKVFECTSDWTNNGIESFILEYPTGAVYDSKFKLVIDPILKLEEAKCRIGWFGILNRRAKGLKNAIIKISPDITYLRETIWTPSLMRALNGHRFIIEINSNPIPEIRKRSLIAALYVKSTRKILLNKSSGIICVTNELCNDLKVNKKYKTIIPNGVKINDLNIQHSKTNILKRKPSVLFLGSGHQNWNGIDKILKFAKRHKEFNFNFIGIEGTNEDNIKYHGYRPHEYIDKVSSGSDVAFSTFALHRKNMREACPLKSRYYLERGLPIVIGYNDPDIICEHDFVLNIGNYEKNVFTNESGIVDFIYKCASDKMIAKNAREFAVKKLSLNIKEKNRLQFINRILNEQ